jgi:hypothetical protein
MTISELAKKVEIRSKPGTRVPFHKQDPWQQASNPWTCTLTYRGRRLTVDYWQGVGIREEPYAADILSNLLSDASSYTNSSSFEDFCSEFGHDSENKSSRTKALKIYRACAAMATKLEKLLGSDYAMFMSAENDV